MKKYLVPVPNYFIVCDDCGDLTTWTGSFSGGGGDVDLSAYLSSSEFNDWTGSNLSQFFGTASFAISASWAPSSGGPSGDDEKVKISATDTTTDYLEAKIQAGPNIYISKSIDGGYERLHFSSSAVGGGDFDDSHLVTTTSFNEWTGSSDSYFYGTSSFAISASWAPSEEFDDSHLVTTTSFNEWTGSTDSVFAGTASYVESSSYSYSGSYALSASWSPMPEVDLSAYLSSSEFNEWTGSTDSVFAGTASYVESSSYSYSGSYALSASWSPMPEVDLSAYLSSSEFNEWTGSTDSVFAGTASYVESSSYSYSGSYALSASWAPSAGGDFYAQGGNSFGATGVLGLLDDYDLTLVANNTTRMAVNRNDIAFYTSGSIGNFRFGNALPMTPTLRLYDAFGFEYCQVRGRWGWEDFSADIGIGLNCFVSSSENVCYSNLAFGNNALRDHRGNTYENIAIGHNALLESNPDQDGPRSTIVIGHDSFLRCNGSSAVRIM
jgi:hypothetical protein